MKIKMEGPNIVTDLSLFLTKLPISPCVHSLWVGAAPEDGLQSGAMTRTHSGEQHQGTAAPCQCPHHRNKRQERERRGQKENRASGKSRRLAIIERAPGNHPNGVASACLQVRAQETHPAGRRGSPSCSSRTRVPTLCASG